jgi:hypothetical protein
VITCCSRKSERESGWSENDVLILLGSTVYIHAQRTKGTEGTGPFRMDLSGLVTPSDIFEN